MTLPNGTLVLGRYRVEAFLAAGGMGQVYRGVQASLGFPVAIKTLLAPDDPTVQARFTREARMMAQVRHPNLVAILDFGRLDDGQLCIVMEFASGADLGDALAEGGAMEWRQAVHITSGVLRGLHALHSVGIVHRDMKPDNVVMVGRDEAAVPKILDLGIAHSSTGGYEKLTKTGMTLGTPHYMAPEQVLSAAVGPKADLFAVGVMLYELLSGDIPWEIQSVSDVLLRLHSPAPPLRTPSRFPEVPAGVIDALNAAMAIEVEERPASAAALADTLDMLLAENSSVGSSRQRRRLMTELAPAKSTAQPPYEPKMAHLSTMAMETPQPPQTLADDSARAVVVARLPPSKLRSREERAWLAGLLEGDDRGYALGAEIWFVVLAAPVQNRRDALQVALEGRYAAVRVASAAAPQAFSLTAAALSGAVPFPQPLRRLITRLLEM